MTRSYQALALAALTFVLPTAPTHAARITPTSHYVNHDETRVYLGVQWALGETRPLRPDIVIGLRQTQTHTDHNVSGADIGYSFSTGQMRSAAVRVAYLTGKCDILATLGVGYAFTRTTPLAFIGAIAPYAKLFGEVDGKLDTALRMEVDTQGCAAGPDTVTTTTPNLG